MNIHYFQRYHEKENVATANTMLLLSRLYAYSSSTFFSVLGLQDYSELFVPEIVFKLQEKCLDSVPDATITQDSFKIVVETKLNDCFSKDQLFRHVHAFGDEKCKILLTLAPVPIPTKMMSSIDALFKKENKKKKNKTSPIIHINFTFEKLVNTIDARLNGCNDEMKDILEDYRDYCFNDELITASDSWKYMKVQLATKTFDFCVATNIYVNKADQPFRPHNYLGLYIHKSVRAIGKVVARITAVKTKGNIIFEPEFGTLTPEREAAIKSIIDNYGNVKHRFFFVKKFYPTDFAKISPRAPMGPRVFDLTQILETDDIPDTKTLAEQLKNKIWM